MLYVKYFTFAKKLSGFTPNELSIYSIHFSLSPFSPILKES